MYPLYTQERETSTHLVTQDPSGNRWVGGLALLLVILTVLAIFSAVFGRSVPAEEPSDVTVEVTTLSGA
jgi:hypothetical protein